METKDLNSLEEHRVVSHDDWISLSRSPPEGPRRRRSRAILGSPP